MHKRKRKEGLAEMAEEFTKKKEVFEDYETSPVPEEKRYSWYSQGMVWAGIAFCLVAFAIGGQLAAAMDFKNFIWSLIIGALILLFFAAAFGVVGARTHLPSAYTSRFALGVNGAKIFGLIIAISDFGWFGYQCTYFGGSVVTIGQLFNANLGSPLLWAVIGGLAMMITAIIGFKGIKYLSDFGTPLLFLLVFIALGITLKHVPFSEIHAAAVANPISISLPAGITMVVGMMITTTSMLPDISRYCKRDRDAFIGALIGFSIAMPLIMFIGGLFYYAYGTADLNEVFITKCNLGVFAGITLVIATWTTNDNNLYSSCLGLSNALGEKNKIPRWGLTLIVGLISTACGVLGIVDHILGFLSLLGVFMPPIMAAVIADYYLYNRNSDAYDYSISSKLPGWRLIPCLSALFGIVVGILCNYTTVFAGILTVIPASIVAMLAAALFMVIANTITKKD